MSDALTHKPAAPDAADALAAQATAPAAADALLSRPAAPDAADALADKAAALDTADELARHRDLFDLDDGVVYLDGNSLGALPRHVPARMQDVIAREWGRLRIRSWEESGWWSAPERIGDRIAPLIGADPGTVVVGDSTSVNVFKALVGAVRLAARIQDDQGRDRLGERRQGGNRDEILVDASTFPTDGYVAESAARMTGHRIRALAPAEIPAALGPRTAAVLVNHVDYRTGRLNDLPGMTAAIHAAGALAVWDLCHSAGALPVGLGAHGVDFAVGCTYKYLNGGPGSPAYLYVRGDHQARFDTPLPGWNSHEDPFGMRAAYAPGDGAVRGRVGTPDILSMLALESALDVWDGVSIDTVRAKSLALTDFFLECVEAYVPAGRVTSVTPAAAAERGSQVSLSCEKAGDVMRALTERGVVGDFRRPDVLRFGFTPLYVGFADARRAATELAALLS
ncbi:kynureninase [Streptomyces sp. NPDC048361]|uniref:kynureninase n=1 Tax=Streptomyces sp. NPDC048361 TaxID=3154720 RepID=UPI00344A3359